MTAPRFASALSGADGEQQPVAAEGGSGDQDLRPRRQPFRDPGDRQVHERDALQDAGNPERRQVERRRRLDGVEQQAEREQDQRPPEDVAPHGARRAAPAPEREGNRRPHREEQKRKHEIGERPAVPRCVLEPRIHEVPAAGSADEDHRRDGDAAKHVERIEPLGPAASSAQSLWIHLSQHGLLLVGSTTRAGAGRENTSFERANDSRNERIACICVL